MVAALAGCGGVGATSGTDTGTGSTTDIPGITSVTSTTETGPTTTAGTTTDDAVKFDIGGPGTDTDNDTSVCADADIKFEPQIPTVLLLIDQSGSMTTQFGDTDRWEAVYNALLDEQDGLVPQLEGQVRFGMALYTSFEGDQGGRECPVITETAPALDNYQAIAATWDASQPEDETPTGESIAAVTPTLVMDPTEGNKIIVLATDGEPDTCAEPNPQNGQDESVDAAAAAFAQGVRTYVISVGNEVSDQHLQDVANAGVGVGDGDPDAPFYKADDAQALADAFADIVDGVRDCKLNLDGTVSEGGEDQCTVYVNGEVVPFGDDDGWQLNNPGEVELVGDACDAIQNGEVQVSIKCACGVVVPVG
ncbi:vWA domain-containing protein [Nannocystis bainbridge]|uniref:VWA domain-containing protein n=1 Tax=Nannocystis bainbridge TaxID=2995303 RepID=A0ABT5E7F8_9BACT|nr:VWA domain-containing protein [Nannocystis bainbridge]MDC0721340.1 VWA domain-containing protein [Nannocystis bainbridge]